MELKIKPSSIYGLKHELYYGDYRDDLDWTPGETNRFFGLVPNEFSEKNKIVLDYVLNELKEQQLTQIIEIGIARSIENSSTYHILKNKPIDCAYLGIDINEEHTRIVSHWNFPKSIALQTDSGNTEEVFKCLNVLRINHIDLLIIDGWHSINQCYLDFKYAKLVRVGGFILLHDTNYHPGPKAILDSVDTSIFQVRSYFEGELDWGVSTLKRLK
jgi:predicted O-methyltransferase YrrM